ncbi:MAG: ribosome biogenesis GTP-binding protein YihA/YsxC [Psittacicella sp.]
MKEFDYRKSHYLQGGTNIDNIGPDIGSEVAFIGRSNCGKSSLLNYLADNKNLAKTSKTPGRTQLINMFGVEEGVRIVDLPGYGYASVPVHLRTEWNNSLGKYLHKRKSLVGFVVLMDSRFPLKESDRLILELAKDLQMQILLVLTKIDKLNTQEKQKSKKIVMDFMKNEGVVYPVIEISSSKKLGIIKLKQELNNIFNKI